MRAKTITSLVLGDPDELGAHSDGGEIAAGSAPAMIDRAARYVLNAALNIGRGKQWTLG